MPVKDVSDNECEDVCKDDDADVGTEFLIKSDGKNESPIELSVSLRSSRRRSVGANTSAVSVDDDSQSTASGPSQQITDIAANAMSLQPTGYTLETAQVIASFLVGQMINITY